MRRSKPGREAATDTESDLRRRAGVAKGYLLNRPLSRFIFREDQDSYYLLRKKLFKAGAPQTCELRLVKNDGGQFRIRLEANLAQDIDGAAIVRVMASDIAERKQAELALKASQARYHALVDQSFEALSLVDAARRCDRHLP